MLNWYLEKAEIVKWKDKSNFPVDNEADTSLRLNTPEIFSSRIKYRIFLFWEFTVNSMAEDEEILFCKFESVYELRSIIQLDQEDAHALLRDSFEHFLEEFNEKKNGTNYEGLIPKGSTDLFATERITLLNAFKKVSAAS